MVFDEYIKSRIEESQSGFFYFKIMEISVCGNLLFRNFSVQLTGCHTIKKADRINDPPLKYIALRPGNQPECENYFSGSSFEESVSDSSVELFSSSVDTSSAV